MKSGEIRSEYEPLENTELLALELPMIPRKRSKTVLISELSMTRHIRGLAQTKEIS
jgi:hypothetical protein